LAVLSSFLNKKKSSKLGKSGQTWAKKMAKPQVHVPNRIINEMTDIKQAAASNEKTRFGTAFFFSCPFSSS
jgi:hypothetical protein